MYLVEDYYAKKNSLETEEKVMDLASLLKNQVEEEKPNEPKWTLESAEDAIRILKHASIKVTPILDKTTTLHHDIELKLDIEGREDDPCIEIHDTVSEAYDYIYAEDIERMKTWLTMMELVIENHKKETN